MTDAYILSQSFSTKSKTHKSAATVKVQQRSKAESLFLQVQEQLP